MPKNCRIPFSLKSFHSCSFIRDIKIFQDCFTALKYFKISRRIYDWIIFNRRFFILCFVNCMFYLGHIDTYMNNFWFNLVQITCIEDKYFLFSLVHIIDMRYVFVHVDPFWFPLVQIIDIKIRIILRSHLIFFIFCVLVICILTGPTCELSLIIHLAICIAR